MNMNIYDAAICGVRPLVHLAQYYLLTGSSSSGFQAQLFPISGHSRTLQREIECARD